MIKKKSSIVALAFLAIVLGGLFAPLFRSSPVHASDEWNVLNNLGGSSSDGAAGDAAMQKLRDATKITFNNAGSVHVELNLNEPLFNLSISNKSWKDFYSGNYTWGKDPDDNWGYVYRADSGIKISNGDSITILGFIKINGNVPLPGATAQEVSDWAKKLQIFYGLLRNTGFGSDDQYEYFVDVNDNGDQNGDWMRYYNSFGSDFATTDGDRGASLEEGFTSGRNDASNLLVRYVYVNGAITAVEADDQHEETYSLVENPSGGFYFKPASSDTDGDILYNSDWTNKTVDQITQIFNTDQNVTVDAHKSDGSVVQVLVAGAKSSAALATSEAEQEAGLGQGGGGSDTVECESSGNALSWVICPIINGSLSAAQSIFKSFIQPYLQTDPVTTDPENPVYVIWKAFRTLGNVVLIFALLFIVFGQSIGGGIVDAYTAKKTMPRILIAAILINLSIYICAVVVDIFNVLGSGLVRLIVTPLKESDLFKIKPAGIAADFVGIGAILSLVAGGYIFHLLRRGESTNNSGSLGTIIGYVMIFVVVPILLAVLGIFLTLIIRRATILLLIIISPVALALFAVPSADKYAKKWFDAFVKTLMVYPIITGIFGISQVLAVVTFQAGGGDSAATSIVTLLATLIIAFAPLFMIPFSFKLAGGVIGGIANTVRSGRDNLKKVWGDDKHNPNSLRHRMQHKAGENVHGRIISGAGGTNSGLLRRLSTVRDQNNTLRANKAGSDAARAAESLAVSRGVGTDQVDEAKKIASDASTSALNMLPIGGKSPFNASDAHDRSQWVGAAASSGYLDHGGNKAAAGAARGAASSAALDPRATREEVEVAGRGAAEAMATMPGISGEEAMAVGAGLAAFHRANGGAAPSAAQKSAVQQASIAAHRHAAANNQAPHVARAGIKGAARGAGMAAGSNDASVQAAAPHIAAAAREAAAGAASNATGRGIEAPQRMVAEEHASVAAANQAVRGVTDAAYHSPLVHAAAGSAAAEAVFDRRSNPAGAGQAAADVVATGGTSDAAAAAGRAVA